MACTAVLPAALQVTTELISRTLPPEPVGRRHCQQSATRCCASHLCVYFNRCYVGHVAYSAGRHALGCKQAKYDSRHQSFRMAALPLATAAVGTGVVPGHGCRRAWLCVWVDEQPAPWALLNLPVLTSSFSTIQVIQRDRDEGVSELTALMQARGTSKLQRVPIDRHSGRRTVRMCVLEVAPIPFESAASAGENP